MIEASVPFWIGAARNPDRLFIRVGDYDKSPEPNLGQSSLSSFGFVPDLSIAINKAARFYWRIQADDVKALACRPFGAIDRMDAIPDRRIRLLQGFQFHRDVFKGEKLAAKIERSFGEALYDQFQSFRI